MTIPEISLIPLNMAPKVEKKENRKKSMHDGSEFALAGHQDKLSAQLSSTVVGRALAISYVLNHYIDCSIRTKRSTRHTSYINLAGHSWKLCAY